MNTIGVLLLAAAATGDSFGYDSPGVGLKHFLRPHVVVSGPAPPGGPMAPGAAACQFGHPGCQGGQSCPGGAGGRGAAGAGAGAGGRRFANVRSQIYFLDPDGMKIGWQAAGASGERVYLPAQLTVPARYNFLQGYIYRLKITDIPARAGVALYPTIEIAPSTPATDAYLTHNPIPVQFTAEDFDQVIDGGNFVTKVLYLPDPKYQELAIAGVETLVSTRLEPGVDPILEADKRGTILLIVRLGAIDLEMPSTGAAATAPTTNVAPGATSVVPNALPSGTVLPPGTLPPGVITAPAQPNVPLETVPTAPAIVPPPPPAGEPAAPATPAAPTPPAPKEEMPKEEAPKEEAPEPEAPKEEAPKVEAPADAPAAAPDAPAAAPDTPKF